MSTWKEVEAALRERWPLAEQWVTSTAHCFVLAYISYLPPPKEDSWVEVRFQFAPIGLGAGCAEGYSAEYLADLIFARAQEIEPSVWTQEARSIAEQVAADRNLRIFDYRQRGVFFWRIRPPLCLLVPSAWSYAVQLAKRHHCPVQVVDRETAQVAWDWLLEYRHVQGVLT